MTTMTFKHLGPVSKNMAEVFSSDSSGIHGACPFGSFLFFSSSPWAHMLYLPCFYRH